MINEFIFKISHSIFTLACICSLPALTFAVGDRDCLNFGAHYEGTSDSKIYKEHGFGIHLGADYRWNDTWIWSLGTDIGSRKSHTNDTVGVVRLFTQGGASYFTWQGKLGFQAKIGPSVTFVGDRNSSGDKRKPIAGLVMDTDLISRPWFTSKYGYNLFVFSMRFSYWKFFTNSSRIGDTAVSIGPAVGVEF